MVRRREKSQQTRLLREIYWENKCGLYSKGVQDRGAALPPRSENGAKAIFSIFAPSIPPGRKPRRCGGLEIFLAKFCFLPLFGGLAGWHDRPTLELPSPTAVALQSSIQPNNRCFPCPYREMYPSSFFVATTLPRKLSVTTPVLGAQKGKKKKPKNLAKKFHPSRRLFKVFGRVF